MVGIAQRVAKPIAKDWKPTPADFIREAFRILHRAQANLRPGTKRHKTMMSALWLLYRDATPDERRSLLGLHEQALRRHAQEQ